MTLTVAAINSRGFRPQLLGFIADLIPAVNVLLLSETHSTDFSCLDGTAWACMVCSPPSLSTRDSVSPVGGTAILMKTDLRQAIGPVRTYATLAGAALCLNCSDAPRVLASVYLHRNWDEDTCLQEMQRLLSISTRPANTSQGGLMLAGDFNFDPRRNAASQAPQSSAMRTIMQNWSLSRAISAGVDHVYVNQALSRCSVGHSLTAFRSLPIPRQWRLDHRFFLVGTGQVQLSPNPRSYDQPPQRGIRLQRLRCPVHREAFLLELGRLYLGESPLYRHLITSNNTLGIDPCGLETSMGPMSAVIDFLRQGEDAHRRRGRPAGSFAMSIVERLDTAIVAALSATAETTLGAFTRRHTRCKRPPNLNKVPHSELPTVMARHFSASSKARPPQSLRAQSSAEDLVQDVEQHFAEMFRCCPQDAEAYSHFQDCLQPWCCSADYAADDAQQYLQVDIADVVKAITSYPAGKAPGPDHLAISLLKTVCAPLAAWLRPSTHSRWGDRQHRPPQPRPRPHSSPILYSVLLLFRLVLISGYCPESWRRSQILPVAKSRTASAINDFRPISLTPVLRRLFEHIVLARLALEAAPQQEAEPTPAAHDARLVSRLFLGPISPLQSGFRSGYSTFTAVLSVHEALIRRPLLSMFLDLRNAYDSVPVPRVLAILQDRLAAAPQHRPFLSMMACLLAHNSTRVLVDNALTPIIHKERGLPQGSLLSPLMFLLVIDPLMKRIAARFPCPSPHDTHFCHVPAKAYADDLITLSQSVQDMVLKLSMIQDWCADNSLLINCAKSAIMLPEGFVGAPPVVRLRDGSVLPIVSSYTYLGTQLTSAGIDFEASMDKRVSATRGVFYRVCATLGSDRWLPRVRSRFARTFILPNVEYLAPLSYAHAAAATADTPGAVHPIHDKLNALLCDIAAWITGHDGKKDSAEFVKRWGSDRALLAVSALLPAELRGQQLAARSMLHLSASHWDNPVRCIAPLKLLAQPHQPQLQETMSQAASWTCPGSLLPTLSNNPLWLFAIQAASARLQPAQPALAPAAGAAAAAAASPSPSLGRPARLVSIIDQEMRQESMRQLSVYRPCKGRQRQKLSRGCLLGCARALRLPTDAAWKPAAFLSVCSLADCLKLCKVLRGAPQQVRGYRQAIHRCPRCLTPFDYQHISCLDPPDHLTGRGGPADTDLFAILQSMRATLQEYCDNQILIHLEPPQGQLQEALRKYTILDAAIYAGQYEAAVRLLDWMEPRLQLRDDIRQAGALRRPAGATGAVTRRGRRLPDSAPRRLSVMRGGSPPPVRCRRPVASTLRLRSSSRHRLAAVAHPQPP